MTQNNSDFNKLEDLIKEILEKLDSLEPEEKETVSECIETIETIKDEKPKKSIIKMALTTLQGVAGTTEFLCSGRFTGAIRTNLVIKEYDRCSDYQNQRKCINSFRKSDL